MQKLSCHCCGRIYIATTREDVERDGGDPGRYERCYICGTPADEMRQARAGDCPAGATLTYIIALPRPDE